MSKPLARIHMSMCNLSLAVYPTNPLTCLLLGTMLLVGKQGSQRSGRSREPVYVRPWGHGHVRNGQACRGTRPRTR